MARIIGDRIDESSIDKDGPSRVRALLEAGASVNSSDRDGRSFLVIGACTGDLDLLNTLLDREADVNQATAGHGRRHDPAGHCEAAVNQANSGGSTPLLLGASETFYIERKFAQ